jgi:tRNA uridine 5-carbamoylmethylation protein Kti12
VTHVRGTPASGKSALSRLLCQLLAKNQDVVLADIWDNKMSAIDYLAKEYHDRGYTLKLQRY